MDKTESTVRVMLTAIEAPLYDVGVLNERGMLPRLDGISAAAVLDRLSLLKYRNAHGSHIYIRPSGEHRFTTLDDLNETSLARLSADGFNPCAVIETSASNFQAWLKHSRVLPKLLGSFAAQTLAERYDADPSAADWRRFGRLPGFTNCKPKHRKSDGLFPFVRLYSHSGQQYPMAEAFEQEITALYKAREQEHEARRLQCSLSPRRGPRLSNLSVERFRTSIKYQDRLAAADIAFCVAAYANGMNEDRIERALEDGYLSRDPQPYKTSCLHSKDDGEGEEMDRTMSIGAAFALVILPPDCGMTLLVSELAYATRAMREAVEQGRSLPVCLSICVQRAALKTPPPFGRTLSFQDSAARLFEVRTPIPIASLGPLPQIPSSRRGSGSRRHTRWASMYRRQRTNQKKRS